MSHPCKTKNVLDCHSQEINISSSSDSGQWTNLDFDTDVKITAVNTNSQLYTATAGSQSTSSYGSGTPRNETIQLCQPSQFSNQYNSNTRIKTETPDTTSTVDGGLSMNINIPPKNLFKTLSSPLDNHTQPRDSHSNLSQQSLSSTQDSNEEIFPSPPPFPLLSPTVYAYTSYYRSLHNDAKRQKK